MQSPYQLKVLDHGEVILRNLAGQTRRITNNPSAFAANDRVDEGHARPFDADDIDPSQAARMSFSQMDTDRTYEEDMKLAKYLLVNGHTSPFEMIQIWLEVKVPIFVDRQFVRHRVWRRNEESARYIILGDKFYIPEKENVGVWPEKMKQGRMQVMWDSLTLQQQEVILDWREQLKQFCISSYKAYKHYIEVGIPPELARLQLHVNHYVHWLGNVDLGNMYKFLALRAHNHAQWEAQQYAYAIIDLLRPHIPGLMKLFDEVVRK